MTIIEIEEKKKAYVIIMLQKVTALAAICLVKNNATEFAIWFDLSGHVEKCYVRVSESKSNYQNLIFESEYIKLDFDFYIAYEDDFVWADNQLAEIDRCIAYVSALPVKSTVTITEEAKQDVATSNL
jgi:hypothetical protein